MDFIEVTEEKLKVDEVSDQVTDKSTGATSLFVGTTRDNFNGKKVIKLEYEAYIPMAKKKMKELCNRLRVKWPDLHSIAIYHRLGPVGPCEASVIIAVSSAHRKSSLEAVHFAIDELKATVPIWKKELYEDGSEWKENKECFWKQQENSEENLAGRVDPSLVQVQANNQELNERINKFIEAKRSDINQSNLLEFCQGNSSSSDSSCARTDAVLVKKRDSKSHLRKSIVANQIGPSMTKALDERLSNMEQVLSRENIAPVPKDVYSRLKALEDRILLVERVSPQVNFSMEEESNFQDQRKEELCQSLFEINDEIAKLKEELMSKE